MITKEQIDKYCGKRTWAKLDRDYPSFLLGYTVPSGTIIQILLSKVDLTMFFVNNEVAGMALSYDAATLLEDE